jgi:hypothetical protein
MGKKLEIKLGEKYGKLTIVKEIEPYVSPSGHKLRKVLCSCDCGKNKTTSMNRLRKGETLICGCNYSEPRKHGAAPRGKQTTEYRAWCSMKYRCLNPNSKDYYMYGAKGISIYDKWIESFEEFFEHIGLKPSSQHSLDRINPLGNYEPGNVRWATAREQRINQIRMK